MQSFYREIFYLLWLVCEYMTLNWLHVSQGYRERVGAMHSTFGSPTNQVGRVSSLPFPVLFHVPFSFFPFVILALLPLNFSLLLF